MLPLDFDSPDLKAARIHRLAQLLRPLALIEVDPREGRKALSPSTRPQYNIEKFLVETLGCFSDWSAFSANSWQVRALFRCLYLLYAEGSASIPEIRDDIFDYTVASSTRTPKMFEVSIELGEAVFRRFPEAAVHNGRTLLYALLTHYKVAFGTVGNRDILESLEEYFWLLGR